MIPVIQPSAICGVGCLPLFATKVAEDISHGLAELYLAAILADQRGGTATDGRDNRVDGLLQEPATETDYAFHGHFPPEACRTA